MPKKEKPKTIQEVLGVDFNNKYGYMVFNGEYYEFDTKDGKPILIKKDKKDIEESIKICKQIAKKLKEVLDGEVLLTEILMTKIDKKGLQKLHNQLFKSKRKYKPKLREHFCVDMKIGNFILPLSD